MAEEDIIGHLIGVEHEAASLLLDAQVEADKRGAAARVKADAEFKSAYEKITAELEERFAAETKKTDDEHSAVFSSFKKELEELRQDKTAFSSLLDSLLFGA